MPPPHGAALQASAAQIKVHGAYVDVRAKVVALAGMSSHADAGQILAWLRAAKRRPRTTFITHGEPAAADTLRRRIQEELGWSCQVPAYRDSVTL